MPRPRRKRKAKTLRKKIEKRKTLRKEIEKRKRLAKKFEVQVRELQRRIERGPREISRAEIVKIIKGLPRETLLQRIFTNAFQRSMDTYFGVKAWSKKTGYPPFKKRAYLALQDALERSKEVYTEMQRMMTIKALDRAEKYEELAYEILEKLPEKYVRELTKEEIDKEIVASERALKDAKEGAKAAKREAKKMKGMLKAAKIDLEAAKLGEKAEKYEKRARVYERLAEKIEEKIPDLEEIKRCIEDSDKELRDAKRELSMAKKDLKKAERAAKGMKIRFKAARIEAKLPEMDKKIRDALETAERYKGFLEARHRLEHARLVLKRSKTNLKAVEKYLKAGKLVGLSREEIYKITRSLYAAREQATDATEKLRSAKYDFKLARMELKIDKEVEKEAEEFYDLMPVYKKPVRSNKRKEEFLRLHGEEKLKELRSYREKQIKELEKRGIPEPEEFIPPPSPGFMKKMGVEPEIRSVQIPMKEIRNLSSTLQKVNHEKAKEFDQRIKTAIATGNFSMITSIMLAFLPIAKGVEVRPPVKVPKVPVPEIPPEVPPKVRPPRPPPSEEVERALEKIRKGIEDRDVKAYFGFRAAKDLKRILEIVEEHELLRKVSKEEFAEMKGIAERVDSVKKEIDRMRETGELEKLRIKLRRTLKELMEKK